MPSDDELRALLPIVQERLPTLGAIGDLVGFLWVDDLPVDPALLVPKRWDAATTLEGLRGRARGHRRRRRASPSRPTSSSRRSGRSPRRAAGRPATCSWRSGSRSTGRTATPPLFDTLVALGRERTLARLDAAIDSLRSGEPRSETGR